MFVLVRQSPKAQGTALRFASRPVSGDRADVDRWRDEHNGRLSAGALKREGKVASAVLSDELLAEYEAFRGAHAGWRPLACPPTLREAQLVPQDADISSLSVAAAAAADDDDDDETAGEEHLTTGADGTLTVAWRPGGGASPSTSSPASEALGDSYELEFEWIGPTRERLTYPESGGALSVPVALSEPSPPCPPPPPIDCSRIVPLGGGHYSGGICEGCWTQFNRCRSHSSSTGGFTNCDGGHFWRDPYPRCHWIGESCRTNRGQNLYGNIPQHCRMPPPPSPKPPYRPPLRRRARRPQTSTCSPADAAPCACAHSAGRAA